MYCTERDDGSERRYALHARSIRVRSHSVRFIFDSVSVVADKCEIVFAFQSSVYSVPNLNRIGLNAPTTGI